MLEAPSHLYAYMCQLPPEDVALNFYNVHLSWNTFARTFPESWFGSEGGRKRALQLLEPMEEEDGKRSSRVLRITRPFPM